MCCENCCSKFERLNETQKEALRELGRHSWTAINVLGDAPDWVLPKDIGHAAVCPLAESYQNLWKAAQAVKQAFRKELTDR